MTTSTSPLVDTMPPFGMTGSGGACVNDADDTYEIVEADGTVVALPADTPTRQLPGLIERATAPLANYLDHDSTVASSAAKPRTKPPAPPKLALAASALGTTALGPRPDALGRRHGVVKHHNVHPPRRAGDPRMPGRQSSFTEGQLAAALRRSAGIHAEACRSLMRSYGRTVDITTMGRLVASSPTLQAVRRAAIDLLLDYAEVALLRKIEAGESSAIHFYLRQKGASRGYSQLMKHAGNKNGAPIKTETMFNFDGIPADKVLELIDMMARAREAAIAERVAADREE